MPVEKLTNGNFVILFSGAILGLLGMYHEKGGTQNWKWSGHGRFRGIFRVLQVGGTIKVGGTPNSKWGRGQFSKIFQKWGGTRKSASPLPPPPAWTEIYP